MPSPVKKTVNTDGMKTTTPTHASKDTPKTEKMKIHNYFYSMSNVLSINPEEDRFKKVILQDINGYKAATRNVVEYGK